MSDEPEGQDRQEQISAEAVRKQGQEALDASTKVRRAIKGLTPDVAIIALASITAELAVQSANRILFIQGFTQITKDMVAIALRQKAQSVVLKQ